jgi:hypothetical protein
MEHGLRGDIDNLNIHVRALRACDVPFKYNAVRSEQTLYRRQYRAE